MGRISTGLVLDFSVWRGNMVWNGSPAGGLCFEWALLALLAKTGAAQQTMTKGLVFLKSSIYRKSENTEKSVRLCFFIIYLY